MKHRTKISSSEGFSQAIFISTQDNRFILKTLKEQEFENVFDKFLIFFVNYLEKNSDSLLCRIYGIFRIKPSDGSGYLLFILLRNAKGPFKNVNNFFWRNLGKILPKFKNIFYLIQYISSTYDLKGSTRGREIEISKDAEKAKIQTRKDLNFLSDTKDEKIELEKLNKFQNICEKDSNFLKEFNFMDYSLYVVKLNFDEDSIKWMTVFESSKEKDKYGKYIYKTKDGEFSYIIFCIIDYLQVFDFSKNIENKSKSIFGKGGGEMPDISCVEPEIYSYRFIKFMNDNFN